jgi:hypothetical protein
LLLDRGPLHLAHRTRRHRLGLERLQQPQPAPELGERATAIAQERVERPRAVAVADQGQAEIPLPPQVVLKQPGLDPLGALKPPGSAGDAPSQQALQRVRGRQLIHQRRLKRSEFLRLLVADHHEFLGAKPVLQGVLCRARLAFRRLGATRLGAVAPARRGALGAQQGRERGYEALRPGRAGRGFGAGHGGIP